MKRMITGLCFVFLLSRAGAQDGPINDPQLKELIRETVANYPKIKELEEQLKLSDVKDELTKTNYLPNISADASYRYVYPTPGVNFGSETLYFEPPNNYDGHVSVNQLIYDFGKTKLQLERSGAEKQLTQDNVDNNKNAAAYETAQAYYTIQFLYQGIAVQEEQIKVLQDNEHLIETKIKNGDALQYDLLTTQVRTQNEQNRLQDLKSDVEKQFIYLKMLTGNDAHAYAKPANNYDDLAIVVSTDQADWKRSNAEAILIQQQNLVLDYDVKAATVNNRPSMNSFVNTGVKNGIFPYINNWYWNIDAGVGITIPIFSANRPKLEQKLTRVNIETNKKALQTLEASIQKDLATTQQDYQNLQVKYKNTNTLVEQAQKAFELAQTRFKEGLITNVELLTIHANVSAAKLQQVQIQYQMQVDKLDSHKTVGTKIW